MIDNLIALTLFSIAGAFTPGPNTLMLTASGQAFGFARTIPHMAGITVGFVVLLTAFGLGLAQLFSAYPVAHTVLKFAGVVYLLYLAWRLARAGDPAAARADARPVTFMEAALFQWVNVKALVFAASVMSAFLPATGDVTSELAQIVLVLAIITAASVMVYSLFGAAIGKVLKTARARAIFNYTMAALVVLSVGLLFV